MHVDAWLTQQQSTLEKLSPEVTTPQSAHSTTQTLTHELPRLTLNNAALDNSTPGMVTSESFSAYASHLSPETLTSREFVQRPQPSPKTDISERQLLSPIRHKPKSPQPTPKTPASGEPTPEPFLLSAKTYTPERPLVSPKPYSSESRLNNAPTTLIPRSVTPEPFLLSSKKYTPEPRRVATDHNGLGRSRRIVVHALPHQQPTESPLSAGPPPTAAMATPVVTEDHIALQKRLMHEKRELTKKRRQEEEAREEAERRERIRLKLEALSLPHQQPTESPLPAGPPPTAAIATPVVTEDLITRQKRLMHEKRELAKKHRLEEEAREEAERRERIRLKLEAWGRAPESRSAQQQGPNVGAWPTGPQQPFTHDNVWASPYGYQGRGSEPRPHTPQGSASKKP
ncbi:hypothetical protein CONLIGDRAFT_677184 [Coniochaeta ligniaria NRRL 30616]|uniref:Uncharacterized protein n=1 Tax=Coniochaeta ligniaria NRRL 30616 TaxID=1408157 RepID=A0A1J7JZW1_9PEZI|nr:hypothetical protein CONLIGDRAFT_677184 [Coniochaeta ligniaria NRRL 30616]